MDIKVGCVVKSKAGRDKNTFLVVTDVCGRYATVCDGDERPVERPKKKNILHLAVTNYEIPVERIKSNRELKLLLKKFYSSYDGGK